MSVILLLLLVLSSIPAHAQNGWYVRVTGGNDATCTAQSTDSAGHANACATVQGAINKSTATGRNIKLQCGDIFRTTTATTTNAAGTVGARNTITYYGEGGGSTCTRHPRWTHTSLLSTWTACATGCPVTDSNIYWASSAEPTQASGWYNTFLQDGATWDATIGHYENFGTTCPNDLNRDHEWCWRSTDSRIYMRSTGGDPDTRYTNPGVEVMTTQGDAILHVQHDYWSVNGIEFYVAESVPFLVNSTVANGIFENNFVHHSRAGQPQLQLRADTGETVDGWIVRNNIFEDSGRDSIDLSACGTVSNYTIDNNIYRYNFAHGVLNTNHSTGCGSGPRPGGAISNNTITDACGGYGMGGGGSGSASSTLTGTRNWLKSPAITGDIRIPSGATCGGPLAIQSDLPGALTVVEDVIDGYRHGIEHGNGSTSVTIRGVTIVNGIENGITSLVNANTVTTERSILSHNGVDNSASSTSFQIGCTTGGGCTGVTFAGGATAATQNRFCHDVNNADTTCLTTMARTPAGNHTITAWRALSHVTGDDNSVVEDCQLTDTATQDYMPAAAGPCDDDLTTVTPRVGTARNIGSLEDIAIASSETASSTSFRINTTTIYTSVEGIPANFAAVSGTVSGAHTVTTCTTEASGVSVVCNVTPAWVGGETITYNANYGALRACGAGARNAGLANALETECAYARNYASTGNTITNNISAGNMRVSDCVVYNGVPDVFRATIADIPTLPLLPASGALGWTTRRGTSTCPGGATVQQNVTVSGNQYLIDNTGSVVTGECIHLTYDQASGNSTDSSGTPVEVESATNATCRNRVGFVDTPPVFVGGTTIDADTIEPCWSSDFLPMTPASGITGVSARCGGVAWVVSGTCTRQGNNCMRCDMTTSCTAGQVVDLSYSQATGNWVDSDTTPNEAASFTNVVFDNTIGGPPAAGTLVAEGCVYYQAGFSQETITITNSILNGTVNGDISLPTAGTFRERCQFSCQGAAACTTQAYHIACRDNGGAWYLPADTHGSALIACGEDSTVSAQAATTDVMTGGTGTFVAGNRTKRTSCTTQPIVLTNGQHTEIETVLQLHPTLTTGTAECEPRNSANMPLNTPPSNQASVTIVPGLAAR